MSRFLLVAREPEYSPGKVEDDRAILEAVAAELRDRGHEVELVEPGDAWSAGPGTVIGAMCQGPAAVARLAQAECAGARVLNRPDAILGCHRVRLLPALERAAVPQPEAVVVDTVAEPPRPPWLEEGAWVKRGDVHATTPGDVVFVRGARELHAALERLRGRGIRQAVVQRHAHGRVVKFYAVGPELVACFDDGGDGNEVEGTPAIAAVAAAAARAIGLEVYGGDVIVAEAGPPLLVDLNDWPSYRRCRAAAAQSIAAHLERAAPGRTDRPAGKPGR